MKKDFLQAGGTDGDGATRTEENTEGPRAASVDGPLRFRFPSPSPRRVGMHGLRRTGETPCDNLYILDRIRPSPTAGNMPTRVSYKSVKWASHFQCVPIPPPPGQVVPHKSARWRDAVAVKCCEMGWMALDGTGCTRHDEQQAAPNSGTGRGPIASETGLFVSFILSSRQPVPPPEHQTPPMESRVWREAGTIQSGAIRTCFDLRRIMPDQESRRGRGELASLAAPPSYSQPKHSLTLDQIESINQSINQPSNSYCILSQQRGSVSSHGARLANAQPESILPLSHPAPPLLHFSAHSPKQHGDDMIQRQQRHYHITQQLCMTPSPPSKHHRTHTH